MSRLYVYPYGLLTDLAMVASLVLGVVLFVRYPSARKRILVSLGFLALLESIFSIPLFFSEGLLIAFITLTSASILAVCQHVQSRRYRLVAGAILALTGLAELYIASVYATSLFWRMFTLEFWMAGFALPLITFIGGLHTLNIVRCQKPKKSTQKHPN